MLQSLYDRYQSVLIALNTSEEAQICILSTIFEVWKKHQQVIALHSVI